MYTRTIGLIAAAFLTLAGPAQAQDEEDAHAGHHPAQAAPVAASSSPLSANFERMRMLIARAQSEQDPAARRRILAEHAQAMREQVRLMRTAAKPAGGHDHEKAGEAQSAQADKGGGDMKKGGMMDGKGGMMGMHKRVEQRLDALEQMLEQLVEREALEQ